MGRRFGDLDGQSRRKVGALPEMNNVRVVTAVKWKMRSQSS
jgi:hypothetical protein